MPRQDTAATCCNARNEHEHLPDGTVRIALSRGQFTLVDGDDWALVKDRKWSARTGKRWGGKFYATCHLDRNRIGYLHQFIVPDSETVDHINGDTLDNRRSVNLRPASRSQNQWNKGPLSTNTSGYKGVMWHKRDKRWRARIWKDNKSIDLGFYATAEEAARAYDAAALELHGEFAYQNFPA